MNTLKTEAGVVRGGGVKRPGSRIDRPHARADNDGVAGVGDSPTMAPVMLCAAAGTAAMHSAHARISAVEIRNRGLGSREAAAGL